jgi:hypothetical protein
MLVEEVAELGDIARMLDSCAETLYAERLGVAVAAEEYVERISIDFWGGVEFVVSIVDGSERYHVYGLFGFVLRET